MPMDRRDRLCRIIRELSQCAPRFEVMIGNHCDVDPFICERGDALRFMTDEGLEIVARYLVQDRASTNRNNARNRAIYSRNQSALRAAAE